MKIVRVRHRGEMSLFAGEDVLRRGSFVSGRALLHIGSWATVVNVVEDRLMQPGTVGLSPDVADGFDVPPDLEYDVRFDGREMHIGPVIAMVAFGCMQEISDEKLNDCKAYFAGYEHIRGLLYVCAADGIEPQRRTVAGYGYLPSADGRGGDWRRGRFPYPGAAYMRAVVPGPIYEDLIRSVGGRLFNTLVYGDYFDKWEFWKQLSACPRLRPHLPETRRLEGAADLDEMLQRHGTVYVKPARDMMSRGIRQVRRSSSGGCEVLRPVKGRLAPAVAIERLSSAAEVSAFVSALTANRAYIVQQAVAMPRFENRGIDFRVMLQKDGNRQWACTGILARFGKPGSIVTNFRAAGYARPAKAALQTAFVMSGDEADAAMARMIGLCAEACDALERCGGHYGDVGADVMIDRNGELWLLEINMLPDHRFPLYAGQRRLYERVTGNPLLYAHALTGFRGGADRP